MIWIDAVDNITLAFVCTVAFLVPLTILLLCFTPDVAELGITKKLLARLAHRPHPNDARKENSSALIREGDRMLSGRELYTEVAAKNAAEAEADMKAWNGKRDTYPS